MSEEGPSRRSPGLVHHAMLGRAIPALVHRANNCLSVIDGTLELARDVDPETRALAQEQSSVLRELLRHLGMHARHDLEEEGEIELIHLLSEVEFLLEVIGRFGRCELELRVGARAVSIPGDRARLHRLLVSLGVERLHAMQGQGGSGGTLRLSFRGHGETGRLSLVDGAAGAPVEPGLWEELSSELRELADTWGYGLKRRTLGKGHAIRIELPLLRVSGWEGEERSAQKGDRILLLQPAGEEAELNEALLSERGYRVEHKEVPGDDAREYDLVLCDEAFLGLLPPDLPPVLVLGAASPDPGVLGSIRKPVRPQELLDRVGAALL